ncbi:MAG: hypothetical protein ACW98X_22605 [Promethearchaeota archaeon]|jgi:hypothetical protein
MALDPNRETGVDNPNWSINGSGPNIPRPVGDGSSQNDVLGITLEYDRGNPFPPGPEGDELGGRGGPGDRNPPDRDEVTESQDQPVIDEISSPGNLDRLIQEFGLISNKPEILAVFDFLSVYAEASGELTDEGEMLRLHNFYRKFRVSNIERLIRNIQQDDDTKFAYYEARSKE